MPTSKPAARRIVKSRPKKSTSAKRVIEGVVKDAWPDVIDLAPWRYAGAAWTKALLRVELPSGRAPERHQVISVAVSAVTRNRDRLRSFAWRAIGARPVRRIQPDAEAARVQQARSQPRAHVVPELGKLVLERDYSWFAAKRTHGGKRYEIAISVDDPDDEKAAARAITAGTAQILRTEHTLAAILERVAKQMTPLYNDHWRDGGPIYTTTDLRKQLALSSITVGTTGRTTVRFTSGDLFADHGVEVRIQRARISEILLA